MKELVMRNNYITWKCVENSEQKKQAEKNLHGKSADLHSKIFLTLYLILSTLYLVGCAEPYGELGGADKTTSADIASIMEPMSGVWYSHYAAKRLDGYTIGQWKEIKSVLGSKLNLFPSFNPDSPRLHDGYAIQPDDYYMFNDDTVYGQNEDGSGSGNDDWGFGFIGIVRAVNIFNGNPKTGAIIIEYLDGAYPQWSPEVVNTPLPFFGVFYRVLNPDCIQMANAVDLSALANGEPYYTETKTLAEAITKNSAINDGEFISWGVVIPQDR
jgi:hypothetical protein